MVLLMTAVPTKISAGQVTEISTMETSVSMVEPLHTATNTVKENTAAVMTRSCVRMENSRVKTSGASTPQQAATIPCSRTASSSGA